MTTRNYKTPFQTSNGRIWESGSLIMTLIFASKMIHLLFESFYKPNIQGFV